MVRIMLVPGGHSGVLSGIVMPKAHADAGRSGRHSLQRNGQGNQPDNE
jgi:hypothetical protein